MIRNRGNCHGAAVTSFNKKGFSQGFGVGIVGYWSDDDAVDGSMMEKQDEDSSVELGFHLGTNSRLACIGETDFPSHR
jgi:hypothetical protein